MSRIFPISPASVYLIVRESSLAANLPKLSPHDMRRTWAKLSFKSGAPIEQIQEVLGHVSIQTTQIYLGTRLELARGKAAVDYIRLDSNSESHPKAAPKV